MSEHPNHPDEFLDDSGRCQACACVKNLANEATEESGAVGESRSDARIRFAEGWIKRFMKALDTELDDATACKVMRANGRACFLDWLDHGGPKIEPTTLEEYALQAKERTDGAVRVEGNTVYFQYMSAAETGEAAEEGACLCPLVETKPEGLSETYCQCSVGYVKQWYDLLFHKPVTVELLESVLMGGARCRFKITVP
jgi:hypothetical protein